MIRRPQRTIALGWLAFFVTFSLFANPETDRIRKSLVRILATTQRPDYRAPWNPGAQSRGVGSGFVIDGKRILTNAHVVSDARQISVDKDGDPRPYAARVLFIAHDCDLALLTVDDHFFEGTETLTIGGLPELHSTVTAYGYPIGGDRMSVTRGVVSRIEFRTYSHSGLDSHLAIQIDAAINPGNSGGPVIQDGRYVGVAFQGFSGAVAQNTGYMIPVPVIARFLSDIKDGRYDGYVELAINYSNLLNPAHRKVLGLPADDQGVVVNRVLHAGSAHGVVQQGDVLLKIDGHPITSDGHIMFDDSYVQMEEVVERKFHGDKVKFDIQRDGKSMSVDVTLKGAWPYRILANRYDHKPEFIVFGGLVFQPLTRNFVNAYKLKNSEALYHYRNFVTDEIYRERPQLIILSNVLPDRINSYSDRFRYGLVDTVNDKHIGTMHDLAAAFAAEVDDYVIRFIGNARPVVLSRAAVAAAQERIRTQYQVISDQHLGEPHAPEAQP